MSVKMADKVKPCRYSLAEWETQKTNIERLYITEDRPLKEVISILERDFRFIASEKQLKSRLPKWGFDVKNLRGDMMLQLARTKVKRKIENKKTSFRVNKKLVEDSKIDRYLRRNDISEERLLSMASPPNVPSPAFSVLTPQSVRSPTPLQDATPLSAHDDTASINFQALATYPAIYSPSNLRLDALQAVLEEQMMAEDKTTQISLSPGVDTSVRRALPADSSSNLMAEERAPFSTERKTSATFIRPPHRIQNAPLAPPQLPSLNEQSAVAVDNTLETAAAPRIPNGRLRYYTPQAGASAIFIFGDLLESLAAFEALIGSA